MSSDITKYSESDFFDLVKRICVDDYGTEQEHIEAVLLFEELSEHPDGSDLIFYPDDPKDATPERITQIIKEWRVAQGLPGFRPDSS
ncbi:bacteriocin immunity protein [Marinobacter halodurans]|uniref:Bacteriocin immunity protein n=1 Tax=Marinobacter halodurans TaxID=2528979 RepID=A0ABY1ZFV5_9GAMM|nr:bacteriocin immunity protein [Marinobacter halodurans]TBW46428.1 bacteriocin immunity protein [Marinobacter halodurans]